MASAAKQQKEQGYDTRNIDRNEVTEWGDLLYHLRKYTEEMDKLDVQENPIPQPYHGGDAMEEAKQILENYDEEVENERERTERTCLKNQ